MVVEKNKKPRKVLHKKWVSHSLWWNTFLILDIGGRGLVLPQLGMPKFVDFSREALLPMRSGWGVGRGKGGQEAGEQEGRGTGVEISHEKIK